jgi:hypothetical protein
MKYLYFTKWLIAKYPMPFILLAAIGIIGVSFWKYGPIVLLGVAVLVVLGIMCFIIKWIIIDPIKESYKEYQQEKIKTFNSLKR